MTKYLILGVAATVFAVALLVLQLIGAAEFTAGASPFTIASMFGAMVITAILPLFVHAAWNTSKGIAVPLFFAFVAFLAYSFPANLGRIGELKEAKVEAATDANQLRSELADINKTLRYAAPDQARECEGAVAPIVPPAWPECRRKTGTVKALNAQKAELEGKLAKLGTELGDTGSDTLAWAFSFAGVKASTIRKISTLGFAVGLEMAIWALVWLGSVCFGRVLTARQVMPVHSERALSVVKDEPALSAITEGEPMPSDEELEILRKLLMGRTLTNQGVADEMGWSKGQASKMVSAAVACGLLQRTRTGREVAISALETVH